MKGKLSAIGIVVAYFVNFTFQGAFAQDTFVEVESLLVVDIESAPIKTEWRKSNATVSGKTITYYASKVTEYSNPGKGLLSYKIQINNPGTYRFQWHCKVGEGTSTTDANDSWLKIPDADDFYAKKLASGHSGGHPVGHIVHPKGVCSNDCPEGAGKNGWFKVYSNGTINWTWRTSTNDNDPHAIFARFDKAGIYTIQISARSAHHFLDRFVMYDMSKYSESDATNLSRVVSSILASTSAEKYDASNVQIFPNPVCDYLEFKFDDGQQFQYELSSSSGQILMKGEVQQQINISHLKNGVYIVRVLHNSHQHRIFKIHKQFDF